jgi:hypothetical protein
MNAVVISRFPVAFILRLVGIGPKPPFVRVAIAVAIFPSAEIFC